MRFGAHSRNSPKPIRIIVVRMLLISLYGKIKRTSGEDRQGGLAGRLVGGLAEELEGRRVGERAAMLRAWERPVLARRLADGLADRIVVGLAGHLAGRLAGGLADVLAGLGLFFDSF
jgi:hypothetical protein